MVNSPSVMHYFSWWLYIPNCLCIFIGELFPAKLLQCTNIWYYSIDLYSYFQISSHRHVSHTSIIEANSKIQAPSSIFHGTRFGLLEGQYDWFTTYLTVRIFQRLRKKKSRGLVGFRTWKRWPWRGRGMSRLWGDVLTCHGNCELWILPDGVTNQFTNLVGGLEHVT